MIQSAEENILESKLDFQSPEVLDLERRFKELYPKYKLDLPKKDIVRLILLKPITELPENVENGDLQEIYFQKMLWARKTGKENVGQMMPVGGGLKKEEELLEAALRECLEETGTIPTGFKPLGKRPIFPYIFFHKGDQEFRLNRCVYLTADILPSDRPYVLDPSEDKMTFEELDLDQLRELLKTKELSINKATGEADHVTIVDALNLDSGQREANYVFAEQDLVEELSKAILYEFQEKEGNFKKKILIRLVDLLEGAGRISDFKGIIDQIEELTDIRGINGFYRYFIYTYKVERLLLQEALNLVNLELEVASLGDSEKEAWSRAPQIIKDWRQLTREKIAILLGNEYLRDIIEGFNKIAEWIESCEKTPDGEEVAETRPEEDKVVSLEEWEFKKMIEKLSKMPESEATEEIMKDMFEKYFGIKKEHYHAAEEKANAFIENMVAEALESKISSDKNKGRDVRPMYGGRLRQWINSKISGQQEVDVIPYHSVGLYRQNNVVSSFNRSRELVELALGMGETIEEYQKNDPNNVPRIIAEAKRKLVLMRVASEAMDGRDRVARLPRSMIERQIFNKINRGSHRANLYQLYDDINNTIVDVCYSKEEVLEKYSDRLGELRIELGHEGFRTLMIGGKEVSAFIHARPQKSVLGMMRKMLIRGCNADEIMDISGRAIALKDQSERVKEKVFFYKKEKGKLIPQEDEFDDNQFVFDFMKEVLKQGGDKVKIVDYKRTPNEGERIDSRGPGGGAEVKYAKFYICYELPDGQNLYEEIMLFNPTEECSAFAHYLRKKEDDKSYRVLRFFNSDGSKTLIEKLFPFDVYGDKIREVFRKERVPGADKSNFVKRLWRRAQNGIQLRRAV